MQSLHAAAHLNEGCSRESQMATRLAYYIPQKELQKCIIHAVLFKAGWGRDWANKQAILAACIGKAQACYTINAAVKLSES